MQPQGGQGAILRGARFTKGGKVQPQGGRDKTEGARCEFKGGPGATEGGECTQEYNSNPYHNPYPTLILILSPKGSPSSSSFYFKSKRGASLPKDISAQITLSPQSLPSFRTWRSNFSKSKRLPEFHHFKREEPFGLRKNFHCQVPSEGSLLDFKKNIDSHVPDQTWPPFHHLAATS